MNDTCKCGICIQYGCDCVETGDHTECMCSECRPLAPLHGAAQDGVTVPVEPTVDNYGS